MTTSNLAPITGISLALDDTWHAVPAHADAGEPWADGLLAAWSLDGLSAEALREQLLRLQANLSSRVGDEVSALVWVPVPQSGYCSAGLVALNWPLEPGGIDGPVAVEDAFGRGDFVQSGDTLLDQRIWNGLLDAGPFVGVYRVTSTPTADAEEAVVETVEFFVFPSGASEFAHLSFTAESIGAFEDMPSQTWAIAQTLEVTVGDADA